MTLDSVDQAGRPCPQSSNNTSGPAGDENRDPSLRSSNKSLDLLQRKRITDIVDMFCPRVVQGSPDSGGDWGMFATPEASSDACKEAYLRIPYIRMTTEIVMQADREPKYDPVDGQKAANRYIYIMNNKIRERVKRKADWSSTQTLRSLRDTAETWRNSWAQPENQNAWLETIVSRGNPDEIHYRSARTQCKSILKDAISQTEQGPLESPNLDSISDCVQNAKEWKNNHPGDESWSDVHNNLLFSLMINYVPLIRRTRTFTDLAQHEQAKAVWPDVGSTAMPSGSKKSVPCTLRNKWGVIGGWLLGSKTKGKQFNFDASSQVRALELMKNDTIPWPTKSLKRPKDSIEFNRMIAQRIHEKKESLELNAPPGTD